MGRVITNGMTLSFAMEATLGVLPGSPQWFELEPNEINTFGTTISKEARTPISRARARRKGVVTDLDSGVEFSADLTLAHLRHFAQCFMFSRYVGADVFLPTAVAGGGFTVPALSAAAAGRLQYGAASATTLVYAHGFDNAANNGLKPLGADPATSGTSLVAAGLVNETVASDQYAEVAVAGIRGAAGDLKIDASGNLTSTVMDFLTIGVVDGQQIHIGGIDVSHQFFETENYGFARIEKVEQHKLTLSKRDQAFVTDDGTDTNAGGTGIRVDILFGQFVRDVPVGHVDYLEPSIQFELASPNLMSAGATGYEYAVGNWMDSISMTIPLTGKATITLGFVGVNTTLPSTVRATNAAVAKVGGQVGAFSSASDIARLRVQDVDEEGLTTDFKSVTFTLTNNVAGEKVIGNLGPKYLNAGNAEADIETQMLFSNADVLERIRCNKTVGFDWVLLNGDGGVAFDLPGGTLDGGGREYPANQSVLLNTTFMAHEETAYPFTVGASFFPVLPAQPCA